MKKTEHLIWVDWMKVLGMYFIIAGHFFPRGNGFIYMFSVPLFFIISGFLNKKEGSSRLFWSKLFYNLIVPLLIISFFAWVMNILSDIIYERPISLYNTCNYWSMILVGQQNGTTSYGGLGVCWFIYTLMLLKIINQYISKTPIRLVLLIGCILAAYYLKNNEVKLYSSWINIVVAYPFFLTGVLLKKHIPAFNYFTNCGGRKTTLAIIGLLILLFVIWFMNGEPMMYRNEFGSNFFLFYLGGLVGTVIVLIISMTLHLKRYKIIETLSVGTIIILGFHMYFIEIIYKINHFIHLYLGVGSYFFSILILALFYPVILASKKYMPALLGRRG